MSARLAVWWRVLSVEPGATAHAYRRIAKGSRMGMNFDSLCGRYWMSTVKVGKPKPYPPAHADRCSDCEAELARSPGTTRKEDGTP